MRYPSTVNLTGGMAMKYQSLLALLVLSALVVRGYAQEQPTLLAPTREHAEMAREVGVWDAEMKLWPTPDAEPVASKGVETVEMMGKFWLVAEFVGDLMGTEFRGQSQMTYDPTKKQYLGTWIDTMSPVLLQSTGTYDVKSHTLTMMMEGVDAMTGKPGQWKSVTTYESADAKKFEMLAPVEGKAGEWWKMMEINYKRRK